MQKRDFLLAFAILPAWRPALAQTLNAEPVEFAPVLPRRKLVFPTDHGAHPDFRTEWWYATGWLRLPDASQIGFQITFFRVRSGIGEASASAFAPRQLVLAHAAIADPAFGRLRHDQRAARVAFGRAGFDTGRTRVWVGDWRLERLEQGAEHYQATVNSETFAYALQLLPTRAPMLNGEAGFSRKAPDPRHASYYYSLPHLQVSGSLKLAGSTRKVTGEAWLDHEWSSQLLPEGAQGWDWIGVNLADGGALMAFRLRRADNRALWSAASLRPALGETQSFAPEAVAFEPLADWRSPRTGITYPVQWQVRVGQRVFQVHALMADQELDSRLSTGAIYWEGAIRLLENGREVGRGYLEMTGYGDRIRVG